MAGTTVKMGKRGTIVLPARLRRQLGLEDGAELTIEARDGEIRLSRAVGPVDDSPVWSAEETAYYMLMNARTKEDWDEILPRVLDLGIDVSSVPGVEPNRRDTLPTRADWEAGEGMRRAARLEELHRPD